MWYHGIYYYACSTLETCIQDFTEISRKSWKTCFFATDSSNRVNVNSPRFPINSEAFASELLGNREE